MSISIKNILKLLAGFLFLIAGSLAIGIVTIFGLVLFAATGNCDYCHGLEYIISDIFLGLTCLNSIILCFFIFNLSGLCILSESARKYLKRKKDKLKRFFLINLLLLILSMIGFLTLGWN